MITAYVYISLGKIKFVSDAGVSTEQFPSTDAVLLRVHALKKEGYQTTSTGGDFMCLELHPNPSPQMVYKTVNF